MPSLAFLRKLHLRYIAFRLAESQNAVLVQVILVCSGAEASLEQEMQLLEAAKKAVGSSSAVFGFIVQPSQVS